MSRKLGCRSGTWGATPLKKVVARARLGFCSHTPTINQIEPKPNYRARVRMLMSTRCPMVARSGCPGPRQGLDSTAAHSTIGSWILLNLAPHLPGTCVPRGRCGGRTRRRPPPPEVGATWGEERMSAGRSLVHTTSRPLHSLIFPHLYTPPESKRSPPRALQDRVTPSRCGDCGQAAHGGATQGPRC